MKKIIFMILFLTFAFSINAVEYHHQKCFHVCKKENVNEWMTSFFEEGKKLEEKYSFKTDFGIPENSMHCVISNIELDGSDKGYAKITYEYITDIDKLEKYYQLGEEACDPGIHRKIYKEICSNTIENLRNQLSR